MKKKKNLLVMIFAILKTFLSIIFKSSNTLPIFDSYLNSGPLFFVAS